MKKIAYILYTVTVVMLLAGCMVKDVVMLPVNAVDKTQSIITGVEVIP